MNKFEENSLVLFELKVRAFKVKLENKMFIQNE